MHEIVEAFGHFTPAMILAMLLAVVLGQIVAVIPGLGGAFLLAVMLPFLYGVDPLVAITMMVAAMSTDGTGNIVTSVIFGIPGSASGVATTFDGHPMARRGEAMRAISAGLTASAVGGVVGAVFLALMIPVARPVVLSLGAPEFFVVIILALFAIAYVREGAMAKSLVAAGLGITASFIGMGPTGIPRYTFGELYLWDGLPLIPLLVGLFAVPEMLDVVRLGRSATVVQEGAPLIPSSKLAWQGITDVFRYWRATMHGISAGLVVGVLPGLGGSAGQFMAYAQVKRKSPNPETFGTGRIEGVIGADAATNSKDGGDLLPTLAFGVPGSASMAILLSAMVLFGVQPGHQMLTTNVDIVWMIVFVLVAANLFAACLVLACAPVFVKLTRVRTSLVAPVVLVIAVFGAFATSRRMGDVLTFAAVGVLGVFMKRYGYSRATFIVGFVLGPLLELYFHQSLQLFGPNFIYGRPVAMAIIGAVVAGILFSWVSRSRRTHGKRVTSRSAR